MVQEYLEKMLMVLDDILKNDKYQEDSNLLTDLYCNLEKLKRGEEINFDLINNIQSVINDLEEKWNFEFELSYYFDPVYAHFKKKIHDNKVAELRKENIKKRGDKKHA